MTSDRTNWAKGPWDDEPDRVEWRMSEPPGYPLLIVRGPHGSLCGYVGVPPGHPAHGHKWGETDAIDNLDVHGGITYGNKCQGEVCHVPAPGEPDDVWWLGFDCGHCFDYVPGIETMLVRNGVPPAYSAPEPGVFGETYRDVSYVRGEVENLAKQLAEMAR